MKRTTMQFMALALMMAIGTMAHATGVVFNVTSSPRNMRTEGLAETSGEIVLTQVNTVTPSIEDGTAIDLIYSVATSNNAPNASPSITGKITALNNLVCTGFTAFAGPPPPPVVVLAANGCPTTISASLSGDRTIRIRYTATVAGDDLDFPATATVQVLRIRVNANAAAAVGTVLATLSGSTPDPATYPVTFNDPQRIVGNLAPTITNRFGTSLPGLLTLNSDQPSALALQTCNFPNDLLGSTIVLRVDEGFGASLTTQLQERALTDRPNPSSGGAGETLPATNGVILRVTLTNVPAGISVIPRPTQTTTGILAFTSLPSQVDQTVAGTPVVLDYVVIASDPGITERVHIPITLKATSTASAATIAIPAIGTPVNVQATIQVLPITTSETTIPRFVQNQIGPTTVASIADCNTRLLMTWVATVTDVETGIAIANTSNDDAAFGIGPLFGATPQNGTCTLTGYPSAGTTPVSFTTASISAGSTLAFGLSGTTGFANFAGYILTVCNFQVAHAFVFITNGRSTVGGPTLAQGYLANVIQGGARPGGAGPVESLGD